MLGTIAHGIGARLMQRRQAEVCYAVTDRRAIFWNPEPRSDGVRVMSVRRGEIQRVVRVERPDGSGHLEFSPSAHVPYYPYPNGFQHIPEVRRVEYIVRNNLIRDEREQA